MEPVQPPAVPTAVPDAPPTRPAPKEGQGHPGGTYALRLAEEGHLNVAGYLRVLIRRWRLVLGTFAALALPGVILALSGPDIFQARARIAVDQQTPELTAIRPNAQVPDSDEIQTHASELRSRAVARRAIARLKIWQNAAFKADNEPHSWRAGVAWVRTQVGGWFSARQAPQAPPSNPADDPGLVPAFLGHVVVDAVPLTRLIDIRYSSGDPRLSADAANALARAYVEQDLESHFQSAKTASSWLDGQLAEQRQRVQDSQAKLQQYREAQNVPSLDDRRDNVVSQKLSDLNAAVTRAKTDRIAKEAAYNQLVEVQSGKGALDTLPVIASSAFIQQQKAQLATLQQDRTRLSEQYGEKHPEMVRINASIQMVEARLQAEIDKIVQSMRNEYLAAQANERSLTSAYEQQKQEAIALSRKSVDYAALEREAQSNQQVYDNLLAQAKQAGMAGELRRSTIRITDPADVPLDPIGPKRKQNLLLAVLGAALFAVGLAFALDLAAREISSPEEIERHLQVPFLGFVPIVRTDDARRPLLEETDDAAFGEAFRRIRTHVMLTAPPAGVRVVMVTSTGPSEGKTVVAANLAVALAKSRQGVVVVDADMRRPALSELFDKKHAPGLAEVLGGRKEAADAMKETSVHGLLVLPAGSGPENPAELLASPRFRALLESLQESFQWVIIDAPPVLAVTDAMLIANEVKNALFVVGSDMTSREAARTAVDELRRAQSTVLGAVLNKVNLRRDSRYYSRYYNPAYARYYNAAPEQHA
jgi:polysaccharide biosynthesis transport protein